MIPEEAVQAAHAAICEQNFDDCLEWRGRCVKAVEAAVPYLLTPLLADLDKWAGRSKSGFYDEAQDDVVQILNPHRSRR